MNDISVDESASAGHHLLRYPETLAVVRLGPGADVPAWAESSSVFSVTATATETTVVCAGRNVPSKVPHLKPLTGFRIDGTLELTHSGVLVTLLSPLAEAGIGVFTASTFDSSWILVPRHDADAAEEAWRRSGHTTAPATPA